MRNHPSHLAVHVPRIPNSRIYFAVLKLTVKTCSNMHTDMSLIITLLFKTGMSFLKFTKTFNCYTLNVQLAHSTSYPKLSYASITSLCEVTYVFTTILCNIKI